MDQFERILDKALSYVNAQVATPVWLIVLIGIPALLFIYRLIRPKPIRYVHQEVPRKAVVRPKASNSPAHSSVSPAASKPMNPTPKIDPMSIDIPFDEPDLASPETKPETKPVEKPGPKQTEPSLTDSLIGTVRKLRDVELVNNPLTESIVSTVQRLKSIELPDFTDSIVTTAKKLSGEDKKPLPVIRNEDEPLKQEDVLKLLYHYKGNSMLSQSMAFDLHSNHVEVTNILDALISMDMVECRRLDLGVSYSLSLTGLDYCKKKGY